MLRILQPLVARPTTSRAIMSAANRPAGPHVKCRNAPYPRDPKVVRVNVPDDKVPWSAAFPDYQPVVFTHPKVIDKPVWADSNIMTDASVKLAFNEIEKGIDRTSFTGAYQLSTAGLPINPVGRTGITGRGALGRWGPNHAADPIVTRWKRDAAGQKVLHDKTKKPILQFVSIQRGDTKEWALPGGMVDPNECFTSTLKREFSEEALNLVEASPEEVKAIEKRVEDHFKHGKEVYRGYVDDPRNTDNAWMETVAVNFHDEDGQSLGKFALTAGDDAVGVRWTDMDSSLKLYASHRDFVDKTAQLNGAHW